MAYWTSKLGGRFLKEEIERLDREHHAILGQLRKQPENSRCAECHEQGTMWASVNLGVFVCVRCSDIHRAAGTHITKVKGCTGTYLWGPDEIASMQTKGNAFAARQYGSATPPQLASKEERVKFAERKYSKTLEVQWPAVVCAVDPARTPQLQQDPPVCEAATPSVAPAKTSNDSLMSRPLSPPPARTGAAPRKATVATPLLDLIDFDSLCGNVDFDAGWGRVPEKASVRVTDFDALLGPCVPEAHNSKSKSSDKKSAIDGDVVGLDIDIDLTKTKSTNGLWHDFGAW